jgi:hypothetical protein
MAQRAGGKAKEELIAGYDKKINTFDIFIVYINAIKYISRNERITSMFCTF